MAVTSIQLCYDDGVNGSSCQYALSPYDFIKTNLVSWWDMQETGTSNRVDSHGGFDLADYLGTVSHTTSGHPGTNALDVSSGGMLRESPDNTFPTGIKSDASKSFHFWLKKTAWTSNASPFGLNATIGFFLSSINSGFLTWDVNGTTIDIAMPEGEWFFVGLTVDEVNQTIGARLNGEALTTTSHTGNCGSNGSNLTVGSYNNATYYWDGLIGQMAYYDDVLDDTAFDALYNSGAGITYGDL